MRKLFYLLVLLLNLTLTSCTTVLNNLPGVYSLDVQQGNIINQEMIDQLRPKMTKRQVLYIMGSSMLVDVFHQKRWDYLYSEQPGGEARQQKRLSLFFDGDELLGVQGDFRPTTLPTIRESQETTVEVPKRVLEKTLWEKITGLFVSDDSPEKPEQIVEDETQTLTTDDTKEKTSETIQQQIENEDISTSPLEEKAEQELNEIQLEQDQNTDSGIEE